MKLKELTEEHFGEPLKGWYVVHKDNGQISSKAFKTKDEAQKYLMTKMFANHHNFEVKNF